MRHHTARLITTGAFAVLFSLFAATPALLAQDATPGATPVADAGRPVHIHAGTCADLDPNPLFPLENITAPAGEVEGSAEAAQAETSVSTVPATLEDILAADHSINVHLSTEEVQTYIACGEIGGARQGDGSIVIGLREQNDSGFVGVAYLVSNPADPTTTNISIFLIEPDADTLDTDEVATPVS